ncbi:MAG: VOC family protein [Propionibacteriaceae bacterium]|nr:VOC family protein [Propionibacteriaceae bacterium]
MVQKIVPNLWFDHTAAEAAAFYAQVLPNTRVTGTEHYPTEGLLDFQAEFAGSELVVNFEVDGFAFAGINAGSEFKPNPAISFFLNFDPSRDPDARAHLDEVWSALVDGGMELMPLGEYPFSPHYAWVQDRYGVNWQLMLTNPAGDPRPFVVPSLMFTGPVRNRAEEAIGFYTDLFGGTGSVPSRYEQQTQLAAPGSVTYGEMNLFGQWFAVMDSPVEHPFNFDPGVSLQLNCAGQAELDRYWDALSTVPEAEQCGWCADRFGVSWQVVPDNLGELMAKPGAYAKLMEMKKIEPSAF